MIANNYNQLDILVQFLTSKFNELPDYIDNQEFITKFDNLLGITIGEKDIKTLKTFIEFCYNKMQGIKLSKENEMNFHEKYSSELVLKCNSLEEKVKLLTLRIEKLEKEKKENNTLRILNDSVQKKLKDNINELGIKVLSLTSQNDELRDKNQMLGTNINKLENKNQKLEKSVNELNIQVSSLTSQNDELKDKNQMLGTNVNKLENKNQKLEKSVNELNIQVSSLKSQNEGFKDKNQMLETNVNELKSKLKENSINSKNEINSLRKYVDSCLNQIFGLNQDLITVKGEKKDIIERDN